MSANDDLQTPRRIFQTGTFDVQNYGDLLFPLLASHRLRKWNIEVLAASPTGLDVGWEGAAPSIRVADMLKERMTAHGVLIGGGNILHSGPAKLPDYEIGDLSDWAYAGLWFGATLTAAMRNIPIAWNAPGVPREVVTGSNKFFMESALLAADYLSVRDQASAECLGSARPECTVVPDTAIDLSRMWTPASLEAPFRRLLERKGTAREAKFLAISVRERSLGERHPVVARTIEDLARAHGLTPLLIAIGPCHDDHTTTRHVARAMRIEHVMLDDPTGPLEITAALANSALYVGASLHGYIASASYDVPGVLVATPRLPKFEGLLAQIDRTDDLAANWIEAAAIAARRLAEPRRPIIPESAREAVNAHWERVANAFIAPAPKMVDRTRFLRLYLEWGARMLGQDWLLTPLIGRKARSAWPAVE